MLMERGEDSVLYGVRFGDRVNSASVVVKVGPPRLADEPCLAVEELAVHAVALGDDSPFPLPKRPVKSTVGQGAIAAVFVHDVLSRIAGDSTVEEGKKAYLMDEVDEL